MNSYESLQEEARKDGVNVIDYSFDSKRIRGLYCDGIVAIRKDMTTTEKSCILSEELGHHHTTTGSYRTIVFPAFVMEKLFLREDGIISCTPDALTQRFEKTVQRAVLPHFLFHDLRHYSASIMHAIGVPDQYILQRGGWASDGVTKSIYRNSISDEAQRQNTLINSHFEKASHEISHDS